MLTRIEKICDSTLEATWLAALVVTPLFFNVYSQRVFEPDKISLLRSLALIALIVWIVKKLSGLRFRADATQESESEERGVSFWRRPLVAPVLLLAAAYLLSTALSVTPRQSFWGSYQRLQGTLTMLSYMVFFFVVLDTLRSKAQWQRLQYAIILASLPVALYGILQHYQLDPLPWGGKTVERVTANLGNSIFLAAYLIMVIPLTVERMITAVRKMLLDEEGNTADALTAGSLLFVLIVQIVAVVFTQSRGPWLGFGAGAYVFLLLMLTTLRHQSADQSALHANELVKGVGLGLGGVLLVLIGVFAGLQLSGVASVILVLVAVIGLLALYLTPIFNRRGWRWLWLSVITQAVILGAMLVVLNIPGAGFESIKTTPYAGRLAKIMETDAGTGRVRVLIWQGVLDMLDSREPLTFPDGSHDSLAPVRAVIGYGPESMWVAYNRFYKPELGGLERRNASPDRSHNETFDSLVTTGVLGFLAYIFLFGSVFYYALHWLGLIRSRRDRMTFILLGVLGALLGIGLPMIVGAAYLVGVSVAVGFITGVMIYVTYAAFRGGQTQQGFDRRHMIIIALLATVVSHFVEIHFGISIVATRTYFFIFAGALSAIGVEQVPFETQPGAEPANSAPPAAGKGRARRGSRRADKLKPQSAPVPLWRQLLPFAAIVVVILIVLDYDFVSNQTGLSGLFTIFWRSWLTHLDGPNLVAGPGALWLVLFTVIVGVILALGEGWTPTQSTTEILIGVGGFLLISLAAWILYGLVQAGRLQPLPANMPNPARADHLSHHITSFYIWFSLAVLLLATSIFVVGPRAVQTWGRQPLLAGAAGALLLILALYFINTVNINLVRADIYFKLGQNTDARRDWLTSLVFYDQASELAPNEDHYQLFRGRALLESARASTDPTQQKVFLERAEEVLLHARALNPLNTDHSANLARYYATLASVQTDETSRRQDLQKAADEYAIATRLSPNAAHLQNEWGTIYVELEDDEKARARFAQSLALDANYSDTYLRLAQLETREEHWEAAAEAYRHVIELNPKDARAYNGLAYVLDKLGRTEEALQTNLDGLIYAPNNLNILQNIALLYQKVGAYDQALVYAERARNLTPENQQAGINALIRQLQEQGGQG